MKEKIELIVAALQLLLALAEIIRLILTLIG
jgi:hypothetical protein